jgi:hypothetical protein
MKKIESVKVRTVNFFLQGFRSESTLVRSGSNAYWEIIGTPDGNAYPAACVAVARLRNSSNTIGPI